MRGKKKGNREEVSEKSLEVVEGVRKIEYLPFLDVISSAVNVGWQRILLLGGTRSGKSYQLALLILRIALDPENELPEMYLRVMREQSRKGVFIVIGRQKLVDFATTIFKDLVSVLRQLGIWPVDDKENEFLKWNKVEHVIRFKENGSEIWLSGADRAGRGMGAGADIVWLNEISEINTEFYTQMTMRVKMFAVFDCNPKMGESHWARKELLKGEGLRTFVHRSTFRDNYFLSESELNNILCREPTQANIAAGTADEYLWKVYGLGVFAIKEGLVFEEDRHWSVIENKSFPSDCAWCWALDVGFKDKMCFGKVGLREGVIYIDERLYQSGLPISTPVDAPATDSLIKRLPGLGVQKGDVIVYDAAAASAGAELRACGYNAIPARKEGSSRSIVPQLAQMKTRYIRVTDRSMGWRQEAMEYAWNPRDPEGNPIGGCGDHAMDMSRYGATYLILAGNKPRAGAGSKAVMRVAKGGEIARF